MRLSPGDPSKASVATSSATSSRCPGGTAARVEAVADQRAAWCASTPRGADDRAAPGRPLVAGKLWVEGGFEDVVGDRLDDRVGAGEHGVAAGNRAARRRSAAGRCGRAAARRAARGAGAASVAVKPESAVVHGRSQRPQRVVDELGDLGVGAEAWRGSRRARGHLLGFDAVLGVLGLGDCVPVRPPTPTRCAARRACPPGRVRDPVAPRRGRAAAVPPSAPRRRPHCCRGPAPRRRSPCGSPRACGAGRRARCRRSGCRGRRA